MARNQACVLFRRARTLHVDHFRIGETRRDRVDAQPHLPVVDGGRLRQPDHAVLAGRICRVADVAGFDPVDRGDVDDRAAAGKHRADLVLHAQPHAFQVDADHFVPLCFGDVGHRREARAGDAGIVDRAIEAAEFLQRGLDHRLDLGDTAHVGGDEQRFAAEPGDSPHDVFTLFGAARRDDDFRALLGEFQRGRRADAGTGAGHQRDLACECLRHHGFGSGCDHRPVNQPHGSASLWRRRCTLSSCNSYMPGSTCVAACGASVTCR